MSSDSTYEIEFYDDSKSPDMEKRREGSHFWITALDANDDSILSLYKNNWGSKMDYLFSEDGFVETALTVKGDDLKRLMQLCDNADSVKQVADYLYKRFSPDMYRAYLNISEWLKENKITTSYWSWP